LLVAGPAPAEPLEHPCFLLEQGRRFPRLALGVLQGLTRQRVRVPDDVAIIGYDDMESAAAAAVPLSSTRQPRHLLGRTAALLLDGANQPDTHEHQQVVFEPELVVREST
jgi:LacI family transcriptional regulator